MTILKRHVPEGDQSFTTGAIVNINLPRENFYRRLNLWIDVETSPDDQVATTPLSECMQAVRVIADNQIIKSYTGQQLAALNCIDYGASLTTMAQDTYAPVAADNLGLNIDFGLAPTDYRHMIASAELASFYLQIVWAPVAHMDSSTGLNFDADLKVHTDEVVADDISPEQLGIVQEREVAKLLAGTANATEILDLPLGNIYRRFIAWAYHSDIWKLGPITDWIDRFEVVHNGNVYLQSGYTVAHVIEDHFDQRNNCIHREGETVATDYAYYEDPLIVQFDKDVANLDEVIDTARSSSLQFKVINNAAGTADGTNDFITTVTQEIIP